MATKKEVQLEIADKRNAVKKLKSSAGKLGKKTEATIPTDIEVMFIGKLCDMLIRNNVRAANIMSGYIRDYSIVDERILHNLKGYASDYANDFDIAKKRLSKVAEKHPLWQNLRGILGFTPYALGLLMTFIKNPAKFNNFSNLAVYSGVASVKDDTTGEDVPVNKANINRLKEIYARKGKEFKGFNTAMSGRLFVIASCLIRSKGYFYDLYNHQKERLIERSTNEGSSFIATKEHIHQYNIAKKKRDEYIEPEELHQTAKEFVEETDTVGFEEKAEESNMKLGKRYMFSAWKEQKCYSTDRWAHNNALRRMNRTLLYLIWSEWRKLHNLEARAPYAMDYLGHTGLITIDEITAYDKQAVLNKQAARAEKKSKDL